MWIYTSDSEFAMQDERDWKKTREENLNELINPWNAAKYLDGLQKGDLVQLAGVGRGLHQVQDAGQPALDDEAVLLLQPTKPRVP